jgi:hypothetical protein
MGRHSKFAALTACAALTIAAVGICRRASSGTRNADGRHGDRQQFWSPANVRKLTAAGTAAMTLLATGTSNAGENTVAAKPQSSRAPVPSDSRGRSTPLELSASARGQARSGPLKTRRRVQSHWRKKREDREPSQ